MAIDVIEVGSVWILKDMEYTSYDEGEDLIHEATYGLYTSYDSAVRAARKLGESDSNLPRGNWVIHEEIVYE